MLVLAWAPGPTGIDSMEDHCQNLVVLHILFLNQSYYDELPDTPKDEVHAPISDPKVIRNSQTSFLTRE